MSRYDQEIVFIVTEIGIVEIGHLAGDRESAEDEENRESELHGDQQPAGPGKPCRSKLTFQCLNWFEAGHDRCGCGAGDDANEQCQTYQHGEYGPTGLETGIEGLFRYLVEHREGEFRESDTNSDGNDGK